MILLVEFACHLSSSFRCPLSIGEYVSSHDVEVWTVEIQGNIFFAAWQTGLDSWTHDQDQQDNLKIMPFTAMKKACKR